MGRRLTVKLETELKFPLDDPSRLRERLAALGAVYQDKVFERNLVFDDAARSLRARGMLLRLRQDRGAVLTVKWPPEGVVPEGLKVLGEAECGVADFTAMHHILERLGYRAAFAYEKVRETWRLGALAVCIDRLPFGWFTELEGEAEEIRAAAGALGFDLCAGSTATYLALWHAHLARLGLPLDDQFVFDHHERERLMAELPA
jgi:adenylate cyclase class 2